jgi:hypothetical protein
MAPRLESTSFHPDAESIIAPRDSLHVPLNALWASAQAGPSSVQLLPGALFHDEMYRKIVANQSI